MRHFKVISVDGKKIKEDDEGRYKITKKSSPGGAARKAFSQLTKKYQSNKLVFVIKETSHGSKKKEYGPYEGIRVQLKPPKQVMYKGAKKPVFIKHEDRVRLIKEVKQKGGAGSNNENSESNSNENGFDMSSEINNENNAELNEANAVRRAKEKAAPPIKTLNKIEKKKITHGYTTNLATIRNLNNNNKV